MTPVPPEAVEAAMKVLGCKREPDPIDPETLSDVCAECSVTEDGWRVPWDEGGCRMAVSIAAAVVPALDLPARDREVAAKALDEAADADDWDSALGRANVRVRLRARASALREGRES